MANTGNLAAERRSRVRVRPESYERLVELARRDKRTAPAQAEWLIEQAYRSASREAEVIGPGSSRSWTGATTEEAT